MFAPEDRDASGTAPALRSQQAPTFQSHQAPTFQSRQTPQFQSQRTPVFQSQRTPALQQAAPAQLGSAYAPLGSGGASGAPPASAAKSTIPVSPFALRPKTVK
jgi:hypothetical protein